MSSVYKIIKVNCVDYECIVIPIATTNPLDNIEALISQLNQEQIHSGSIIFDFIFSSGNTQERYAKVLYDNGFVNNSFQYIEIELNDPIRRMCSDYFLERIHEGKVTMLNNSQLLLLKNGYVL